MKRITNVIMFLLITLFINVNVVKAEGKVEIKSAELIDKSTDVTAEISSFNDLELNIDAKMYNIDDYFKYKIVLKNNTSNDLKIVSITDNNELEYINNAYQNNKSDFKSGEVIEVIVTTKYIKQIEKYKDNFTDNFVININYENGESTNITTDNKTKLDNPNTLDNVNIYIFMALISILLLIIFVIKSKRLKYMLFIISLFASITSIKATDLTIKVTNNINLELYGPKKNLVNEILRKRNADDSTYEEGNKKEVFVFNHESTYQTKALTDYRYIGNDYNNINNYIYFNCTDEFDTSTCEIWRIIGVFSVDDGTGNFEKRVKIARGNPLVKQMPWSESDINDWKKSTLNNFLNGDYYNNINVTANEGLKESARDMIDDAVFYLGGTEYHYASVGTPEEMYQWERGSKVFDRTTFCQETGDYRCQSSYCNSSDSEHQHICNYQKSSLNWTGKVGLMYPSDISSAHAKGVNDKCYNDSDSCYHIETYNDENYIFWYTYPTISWLKSAMLINPVTNDPIRYFGGDYRSIYSSYVNWFCEYGPGCNQRVGNVYPTVYLKPDIYTIDGDGTLENPYQIISSESEITSNYIYFEKPNEWANPHAYITGDIENSWPGVKLDHVTGNIYSFRIKDSAIPKGKNVDDLDLEIQFNNGGSTYNTNSDYKFKLSKVNFEGFNKVYKISEGSTSTSEQSSGSWDNYEEKEVLGKIYYRVPTTWEYPHAYIFKDNGESEPLGKWPGVELTKYKDNIYYFEVTSDMIDDDITNYTVTFNNGGSYYHQSDTSKKYKLSDVDLIGYDKIYTALTNSNSTTGNSTGYWDDID